MSDAWAAQPPEAAQPSKARSSRVWLIAGVVLALIACLGVFVTSYVHEHVPTVGRLERAVGRVEPPRNAVLLSSRSTDTCFAQCPAVVRWYAVPDDPDVAVAAFAKALTAAGFTHRDPLPRDPSGPRTLATWTGYGTDISLQGFLASEEIYRPSDLPTAPAGDNYLELQVFPAMKR